VAALALRQQKNGLDPDIICSHPGWGDSLYLKEVFPRAKFLSYFEFYHSPDAPLVNFDAEFPTALGGKMSLRTKNATNLLSLEMADLGVCPTRWQWSTFPDVFKEKIRVVHDGVDTELLAPKAGVKLKLDTLNSESVTLSKDDEVITYSVRNLEPSRGFHVFMRALPLLQKRRPRAITLVVGGDEVSYGKPHPSGKCWREVLLEEVKDELDLSRVIFVGKLPYATLLNLFRISSLHIYLTTPFVLSWSMLEAMACGAPVLASATPPVTEVIEDGVNGVLFDYHNGGELVAKADELLSQPQLRKKIGAQGRQTIVDNYDLKSRVLPAHIQLIKAVLAEER
jgi:glycosyltransferase involved in cell wall biosynthesis